MRINTNVSALNAQKNLFLTNKSVEGNTAKLSSGLRISRAADDAAGLAIANNLRNNTREAKMAVNNAQQANAFLQIAEGAASTIQRILERQSELSIQFTSSQNAGVTDTLESEYDLLSAEISRIIDSTEYNGEAIFSATARSFTVADTASGADVSVTLDMAAADVTTAIGAGSTDAALTFVNSILGSVGAAQNRLDYTVANLQNTIVNYAAAESTIRDLDMAAEVADFQKNNILVQAGSSILAQANQSAQSVLSLLR
ncbi:MAG: flagellin [Gemmatimonadaceae bacterium]|jgi:flagellin|nr:flagellin [Gemmatimonadaceae bacterium]